MIQFALLHYFADAKTEADLVPGMKAVCGHVMTKPVPGIVPVPRGLCPVCSAILERIN